MDEMILIAGNPNSNDGGDGSSPPEIPSGESGSGTPPEIPSGEGGTPPDFSGGGGSSSSSVSYSAATSITSAATQSGQTYTSSTADENALLIDTSDNVVITNPTVEKTGDSDGGDNCNFYGINSAVMAMGGANVSITGGNVTASAKGANGIFSYGGNGGTNGAAGDGTTVYIENVTITTSASGSGGIMTTGGGTTVAKNLTITTTGQSSAPIRTDRGGGSVTVNGGSYTSSGLGSPAIYSTADITVEKATLTSNLSEGVCIEGQNSVALNDCTLTASNTQTNGNAQFLDAVILYQSQSGDAADGTSTFSMTGGELVNKSGHLFHVTNTEAVINLSGVTINDSGDGIILSVCDDGWSGASNVATLNVTNQTLEGDILVGDDSTLTLNISDSSTFTGNISGVIANASGTAISSELGTVNVSLDSSSKWYLTADTYVTNFEGTAANVITGNYKLYENNVEVTGTTTEETSDTGDSVVTALTVNNTVDNTLVSGSAYNDTVTNSGRRVTIQTFAGDDYILNDIDSSVTAASIGNSINAGEGNDTIHNHHSYHPTLIGGAGDDSIVVSRGHYTFIDTGDGNDSVIGSIVSSEADDWRMGGHATIYGGDGDDYLDIGYSDYGSVYGGEGNDTIITNGVGALADGGTGNNLIRMTNVERGDTGQFIALSGDTTVENFGTGFGAGTDSVYITGDPAVDFKAGGLILYDGTDSLTFADVTTTAKLNLYYAENNWTSKEIFIPDDTWYSVEESDLSHGSNEDVYFVGATAKMNHGVDFSGVSQSLNVTMNTDYNADPQFWVNNIHSVRGGAGATTITGSDKSDTIIAGTGATTINAAGGDDFISLTSARARVEYVDGDGNDFISGFNANSTLNISGTDYSSVASGDDLILTIGDGEVTLGGAATLSTVNINGKVIIIGSPVIYPNTPAEGISGGSGSDSGGESGAGKSSDTSSNTSGNTNSNRGGGNTNSNTNSGNDNRGGNDSSGGNDAFREIQNKLSGATSSSGYIRSTTPRTATGSSTSTRITSSTSTRITSSTSTTTRTTSTSTSTSNTSTSTSTTTRTTPVVNQHVYTGGNAVISNYTSGQPITLGSFAGASFDGNGNFVVQSDSGALVIENAVDKVVDLRDGNGNAFIKAYTASTPGIIDGRGLAGFEVINGSALGSDIIQAGDGGSQLWGGADFVADALIGGAGADIFVGGKNYGADNILNASSADVVNFNDASLSDIVATAEVNGTIAIGFNTGNVVSIQSTEPLSAAVRLADGSAFRYNHVSKSWQSA